MRFVSVRDLRGKSAEIWQKLSQEKDIVITSNGRPIAVLSAVSEDTVEESLAMLRRARAMTAVEVMQSRWPTKGAVRPSLEETNAEIRAVRKNRSR